MLSSEYNQSLENPHGDTLSAARLTRHDYMTHKLNRLGICIIMHITLINKYSILFYNLIISFLQLM